MLIAINKNNGNIIKQIPSEEHLIRKNFKNNLSQNNRSILYLNSFGSLYSIDKKTLNINWGMKERDILVSEKDLQLPFFSQFDSPFKL